MLTSKLRSYLRQHHVGLIAVFLALGGSAYAASKIDSQDVADNSLTGADVRGREASGKKKFTQGSLTGADIRGSAASGNRKAVDGSLTGDDLKDGGVFGPDIADGSLGAIDIADDSLTGLDVLEGSLGPVPKAGDSDSVGGFGPAAFAAAVRTNEQWTSDCDDPAKLTECAPVTIEVPAGHKYRVAVWASATVQPATSTEMRHCAGIRNVSAGTAAACFKGVEATSLGQSYAESVATSGDTSQLGFDLGPGTWRFSTMLRPFTALNADGAFLAHTTVLVSDASAPGLAGVPTTTCCTSSSSSSGSSGSSGQTSSGASGQSSGTSGNTSGGASGQTSSGASGQSSGTSGNTSGGASGQTSSGASGQSSGG